MMRKTLIWATFFLNFPSQSLKNQTTPPIMTLISSPRPLTPFLLISDWRSLSLTNFPSSSEQNEDKKVIKILKKSHFCNCRKTQCLKLYCECFSSGEMCSSKCACSKCSNNQSNQALRHKIIESMLFKDPDAFNSKYLNTSKSSNSKVHKKGCNCRKSHCLKNYCECYQGKVACSESCNCSQCHNKVPLMAEKPFKKLKIWN